MSSVVMYIDDSVSIAHIWEKIEFIHMTDFT